MNILKKAVVIAIVAVMALCFAGCHPKNEIAVKVGDVEFSSAYYMCAFIDADAQAKQKVDEDAQTNDDIDTSKKNYYYSAKIDGKKYSDWVKDTAIEKLKEFAAYKIKCEEAGLKISDTDISGIEMYASSAYSNGVFSENGIGYETFKKYMTDSYYSTLYFDHIYGKDGEKAIPDEDITDNLVTNYLLADLLICDFSGLEEEEKTEKTALFEEYANALKNSSRTFEEIYKEYNKTDETDSASSQDESQKPQDQYAQVLGSEDTRYAFEHFDEVKAMATGEVKIITEEDGAGMMLILKKDITADPYYLENLDLEIRHALKDEEMKKDIDEYSKTLKTEINDYAVNRFKVKKIVSADNNNNVYY